MQSSKKPHTPNVKLHTCKPSVSEMDMIWKVIRNVHYFFYFTTIYSVHISMCALKQISKAWVTSYTIEKEMFSGTIVLWAGRVQCDTWGVFSIVRGLGDWPLHYFNATYIFVNLLKQICNKLSWKLCLNIHIGSSRI